MQSLEWPELCPPDPVCSSNHLRRPMSLTIANREPPYSRSHPYPHNRLHAAATRGTPLSCLAGTTVCIHLEQPLALPSRAPRDATQRFGADERRMHRDQDLFARAELLSPLSRRPFYKLYRLGAATGSVLVPPFQYRWCFWGYSGSYKRVL
ncbi:hypothetical protein MKEN_00988700 [Mycena kentingensis (nom. inval.)]|nr:hypothetical protein MKEN_00988700 [Mycena kentingensis (nom. inval.)]